MSATTLTVEEPGLTTLQDLGRTGWARLGVAANGAGDRYAAAVAAVLVGNAPDSPLLEVTATGLTVTVDRPALVAVTGAAGGVCVDGHRQPAWQTLAVGAGARITVEQPRHGLRSYLAVRGELAGERTLDSVAPDALLGVGTRLAAGDQLCVETGYAGLDHPHTGIPVFRFEVERPQLGPRCSVPVTAGPEAADFDADGLDGDFEVTKESDHVGLRLHGPAPERHDTGEILSRGVPVGAVQVPPTGGLLLLLRGRLVTAGYPVAAVATTVAVDRLAQVGPGDVVTFAPSSVADAVAACRRRAGVLEELAATVRGGLAAAGVRPATTNSHS